MVLLYYKHDTWLWTAANHYSFVYIIFWPLVPVSHLYAIIALLCLGHTRERHDTFTLIYTPPPAALYCFLVWKQYTAAQPFLTYFCPPNEEWKWTSFEVYLGLKLPKQKRGEKSAWVDRASKWKDKRHDGVRRNRYLWMTAGDGQIHREVQHKESERDWDGKKRGGVCLISVGFSVALQAFSVARSFDDCLPVAPSYYPYKSLQILEHYWKRTQSGLPAPAPNHQS